jgi:undecaprenyl-diphosphatase
VSASRAFVAAAALLGTVGILTVAVAADLTDQLDRAVLEWLQARPSFALDLMSSLITVSGGAVATTTAVLVLTLWWTRRHGWSGAAPLAMFVAVAIEWGLKWVVPHEGPPAGLDRDLELVPSFHLETPYAFPSGHALRAAFLSVLLARWTRVPRWILAAYAGAMAISRIYAGQHWPSDVAGGILLGAAVALIATPLAARLGEVLARVGPRRTAS